MLKKPGMLNIPNVATSLFGGELACSGNTCVSSFSCSSVDSTDTLEPDCGWSLGSAAIVAGVSTGVAVGILIT